MQHKVHCFTLRNNKEFPTNHQSIVGFAIKATSGHPHSPSHTGCSAFSSPYSWRCWRGWDGWFLVDVNIQRHPSDETDTDEFGAKQAVVKIYQDISRYMPSQVTKHYNSRPMMCILSQLHLSAAPTCAKADKEFASSWWKQGIHRVWHEVVRDPRGIPYSNHTWWISIGIVFMGKYGKGMSINEI